LGTSADTASADFFLFLPKLKLEEFRIKTTRFQQILDKFLLEKRASFTTKITSASPIVAQAVSETIDVLPFSSSA